MNALTQYISWLEGCLDSYGQKVILRPAGVHDLLVAVESISTPRAPFESPRVVYGPPRGEWGA